jgi:hypothetical protein
MWKKAGGTFCARRQHADERRPLRLDQNNSGFAPGAGAGLDSVAAEL